MDILKHLINEYGVMAMFLIILLEYACFPVSSEIVLPFSGAVASMNQTPFLVILPLSILAGLIGTGLCYIVGWYGGGILLQKLTTKFPKTKKGIDSSYAKFNEHGAYAVCIGRVIPLIRTYIALIAGATKLNPITYFSASLLGITVWNTILIGLGYSLRENHSLVASYYNRYKHNLVPIGILCLICLVGNFIYKKVKKKVQQNKGKDGATNE